MNFHSHVYVSPVLLLTTNKLFFKGVVPKGNKRDLTGRDGIQDKMEALSLEILTEISEYLLDMSQHVTHMSQEKK